MGFRLCRKFSMVKWPFEKVEWLPKGWTGHFEKYIVLKVCHITCFKKEHQLVASTPFFLGGGPWFSKVRGPRPLDWLERISTTDLFLGFNAQLNQVYRRGFFPLYIIHSIFPKKKTKPGILFWITLFRESPCRSTNFRLSFDFWRLAAPTLPRNVCLRTAAVLLMKHICLHISSHPPIRLQRLSAMPLAEKFCALKLGWKLWIAVKWHA